MLVFFKEFQFFFKFFSLELLIKHLCDVGGQVRLRKLVGESCQQPMPVNAGVPVEASVEHRVVFFARAQLGRIVDDIAVFVIPKRAPWLGGSQK